jgi:ABC-type Mn2+/Zn2+ transport system ATPase subunit
MNLIDQLRSLRNPEKGVSHIADAPFLTVQDLTVSYNGTPALESIDFELQEGQQVAVVGPNGAGKSTLFKAISGVLPPRTGEVRIFGRQPGGHICIAYVPQRSEVDWKFPATVKDVVMMGRVGQLGLFNRPREEDWDIVHEYMQLVRIEHLANRQIEDLSGGQQQRMFIAQSLAQHAHLLMLDEPLNGLDLPSQEEFFTILEELRQRDVTVMVAMHDLNLAAQRFDRILLLNRKLIRLGRPHEVLREDILRSAYGSHLHMVDTADGLLVLDDTCCDD